MENRDSPPFQKSLLKQEFLEWGTVPVFHFEKGGLSLFSITEVFPAARRRL